MKFISKLLHRVFLWKSYYLSILVFVKICLNMYSNLYINNIFKKIHFQTTHDFHNIFSKQTMMGMPFENFEKIKFQIIRYEEYLLRTIPYFLYVLKYFCDDWEVSGSRFWQNFRRSQNHLKRIAIWPKTLINRFGII